MKIRFVVASIMASLMLNTSAFGGTTGFDGSQVTITAYCCTAPISSNAFTIPKTATVDLGVEFPSGSIITTTRDIITSNVDILTSMIVIDYTQTATSLPGTFNGFGFDFSGAPSILGVSLNPLSTFSAESIGLSFDNNSVFYTGAGLSFSPTSRVIIDVVLSPVPEPSAGILLAVGLLVLTPLMHRRRKLLS